MSIESQYLRTPAWPHDIDGIDAGCTLIHPSAANGKTSLEEVMEGLNLAKEQIVTLNQVHKARVLTTDEGGHFNGYDAVVTSKKGLCITIKIADCAAVLFIDPVRWIIGAAHAGWRGAAAGIVPETVAAMKKLGANPLHMNVYLSPCISVKAFEVGEEVASSFPENVVYRENRSKKPRIDLKAFLKQQCTELGIPPKKVAVDPLCTVEDDRCYSFRRQGVDAGRMIAFLRMAL